MEYCKSKTHLSYTFDTKNAYCWVDVHPQQKWLYCGRRTSDNAIQLSRKNISITIPMADFKKHWIECK